MRQNLWPNALAKLCGAALIQANESDTVTITFDFWNLIQTTNGQNSAPKLEVPEGCDLTKANYALYGSDTYSNYFPSKISTAISSGTVKQIEDLGPFEDGNLKIDWPKGYFLSVDELLKEQYEYNYYFVVITSGNYVWYGFVDNWNEEAGNSFNCYTKHQIQYLENAEVLPELFLWQDKESRLLPADVSELQPFLRKYVFYGNRSMYRQCQKKQFVFFPSHTSKTVFDCAGKQIVNGAFYFLFKVCLDFQHFLPSVNCIGMDTISDCHVHKAFFQNAKAGRQCQCVT